MVHNGIEYGDMQLIGEAFLLLKNTQNGKGLSRTTKDCARIFDKYNRGKLKSFLVEITAGLLKKRDDRSDAMLVDQARRPASRVDGVGALHAVAATLAPTHTYPTGAPSPRRPERLTVASAGPRQLR